MATSKAYQEFIAEQLSELDDITLRPMMGEYLLYYRGVLVGGIYDERVLIKESPSTEKYALPQVIPYETAKRTMYHIEDVDDRAKMMEIIEAAYEDLKQLPKKSSRRRK